MSTEQKINIAFIYRFQASGVKFIADHQNAQKFVVLMALTGSEMPIVCCAARKLGKFLFLFA